MIIELLELFKNYNKQIKLKMISQEQLFYFFQDISVKLHNEGYPILDNIIEDFPGFFTEQENFELDWEEKLLEPLSEEEN